MITVSVKDEITPYISAFLRDNPRFMRSLTKSLGWYVQRRTKELTMQSRFTSQWQRRIPFGIRRKLDPMAPRQWLGRLRNAIGYQYHDGSVVIGWTSATAAYEGRIQELGTRRTVTPFLRKYFGKRGVHLRWDTKFLNVPARPIFKPAMKIITPELGPFMTDKVSNYITRGGFKKNAGKGRKYEVFG